MSCPRPDSYFPPCLAPADEYQTRTSLEPDTMPPGSADAAALEQSRALADEPSAEFWAIVERTHAAATFPIPGKAPRRH